MNDPKIVIDLAKLLGFDQMRCGTNVPMNASKVGVKTCLSYRAFTAAEPESPSKS